MILPIQNIGNSLALIATRKYARRGISIAKIRIGIGKYIFVINVLSNMKLKVIVFSYNRPAQLDLLLRSMKRFTDFKDIWVSYMHDPEYQEGYRRVILDNIDVHFVYRYDNLKDYVMRWLDKPYVMFCPDDDVFIGKVSLKDQQFKQFANNPDILCLSLRLGWNCNYCFDQDTPVEVPKMIDGMWEWQKYPLDWGYPMSCSCTIFRTNEIKPILERLEFDIPSHIEAQMHKTPLPQPLMLCYPKQKVLEMPFNSVQNEFLNNRTGDISIEWLNNEFMKGKIIDLDYIVKQKFNSPQQLADIKMTRRCKV